MKLPDTERSVTGPPIETTPWRLDLAAYRALTRLAQPAAGVMLRIRERQGKEDPVRRGERFGAASLPRPPGLLAWVHAASVGEANAALPLIAALRQRRADITVLVTTGTVTSAGFVASRQPEGVLHQFVPLDAPAFVRSFLDHWRPGLAIFTEQEIWPNLILETSARGIPLALVNARMSDRSFARWEKRAGLARTLFSRFDVVTAQNAALAERFRRLGARGIIAAGNLKIDAPPLPIDVTARDALERTTAGRPRLVAASTHPGEDGIIAGAHRLISARVPGLLSIIAPRHPERGPAIAEAIAGAGLSVARRANATLPARDTDIYIADTIGELGVLYALAPIAFIGGSLVPHGGQNPIEAVRHRAAVLTGPHWHNFPDAYQALLEAGGAVEITSASSLADAAVALFTDPHRLADQRRNADRALGTLAGALERTIVALLPLLPAKEAARSPTGAV